MAGPNYSAVYLLPPTGQITNWATNTNTKTRITPITTKSAALVELWYFAADTSVNPTIRIYHNDNTNSRQIAQFAIQVTTNNQLVNLLKSTYFPHIDADNPLIIIPANHYLELDMTATTAGEKNVKATIGAFES